MSEIRRRDPRRERIARNRLHPEHAAVCRAQASDGGPAQWLGPNGIVRKNPRALAFIGPNGIRRIDRGNPQAASAARGGKAAVAPRDLRRLVSIEQPDFFIAVVPDMPGGRLSAHDRDVLGLARQLADAEAGAVGAAGAAGAVVVVLFGEVSNGVASTGSNEVGSVAGHEKGSQVGSPADRDSLADAGADRVVVFAEAPYAGYAPEAQTLALAGLERTLAPRHWLFPDSQLGGGDLGRRLAAALGERAATHAWRIADGRCTARGAAGATDITRPTPRLVLALPECAEPVSDTRHAAAPLAVTSLAVGTPPRIEDLGAVAVDAAGVELAEAEFILAGGNGIREWAVFHDAARQLGATEGASRVAVDNGFMPRHRQVGATGTSVTARVYLAAGISGAVQHLQGIQQCEKVVAVNVDVGCDMVKRADLTVVADADAVLGALAGLVRKSREEQRDAA